MRAGRSLPWVLASVLALAAGIALWPRPAAGDDEGVTARASGRADEASPREVTAAEPPAKRRAAAAENEDEPRGFPWFLERLVELGVATSAALDAGDDTRARASDRETRRVLERLFATVDAAGEHALEALIGLPRDDRSLAGRVRRKVCLLVVRRGLESRWARASAISDRRPLDDLLAAVLGYLPLGPDLADDLAALLRDRPFLGLAQEPAVLELVARVPDEPFLADAVTGLLLTLWRNLEASGARTPAEIASLALVFAEDANPSRRRAAFRRLLTAQEGRYRSLVVQQVRRRRDGELAEELAAAAARSLPVEEAMPVIRAFAEVATRGMLATSMTLAGRDPEAVGLWYEQLLGDGVEPGLRADLVAGLGTAGGPAGTELALRAFHQDPDPRVRVRAVLALTGSAPAGQGETVVAEALADPELGRDPGHLGRLARALENLGRAGRTEAVDRFSRRLLARETLRPDTRRWLEAVRERYLAAGSR